MPKKAFDSLFCPHRTYITILPPPFFHFSSMKKRNHGLNLGKNRNLQEYDLKWFSKKYQRHWLNSQFLLLNLAVIKSVYFGSVADVYFVMLLLPTFRFRFLLHLACFGYTYNMYFNTCSANCSCFFPCVHYFLWRVQWKNAQRHWQ
jgi:hypothetical protein